MHIKIAKSIFTQRSPTTNRAPHWHQKPDVTCRPRTDFMTFKWLIPAMESTIVVPTFHHIIQFQIHVSQGLGLRFRGWWPKLLYQKVSFPFHTHTTARQIPNFEKSYLERIKRKGGKKRMEKVFRPGLEPATSSLLVNSSRRALPHYSRMYQRTTEEAAGKVDYIPPSGCRDEMR